ncbi:MAG: triose-phosphate isomerase [Actinobacteria bacterium]|nr:triose-phosphate isomerase [Actinomycetota bacterium]
MNLDHLEAIQLVQRLGYHLDDTDYDRTEVVVCPAFTALRSVQTLIEGDRLRIGLGAQDCHWEESGSFTGAVSPGMLAKLDVSYVVCGHSERRRLFGETDDVVNRKVRAVLAHGMTPILCVGESEEQRDQGRTESVVVGQVEACLDGVEDRQVAGMVIAYEPVWAIGTGRTAEPGEAGATCGVVRAAVAERRGTDAAEALRVQYGGSVKPGNIEALMRQADIDGTLVGGASLDPDDFAVICRWHRL